MSDVDQQVNTIKTRIEVAQRKRARAEADQDAARAAADNALTQLKSEYGVSTVDEAKAMMAELQSELNACITQTRQSLDELNL